MALVALFKVALLCLVIVAVSGKPGKGKGGGKKSAKAGSTDPGHGAGKNWCVGKKHLYEECEWGRGICYYHHRKPVYGHLVCTAICGQPSSQPNTKPVPAMSQTDANQLEGATYTYACKEGTAPRPGDVMDVHCTYHGTWTDATFKCLHDCGTSIPLKAHQTVVSTEGQLLGYHAKLGCAVDYSATSCMTAECKADGWDVTGGKCLRDCGPPDASVFGNDALSNPHGDHRLGDIAMYHCTGGLVAKGSLTTVCDASGDWVKSDPTAKCVKDCGNTLPSPISSPYTVMTASSDTLEGGVVVIGCESGYSATKCITTKCTATGWSPFSDGVCEQNCVTPDLVVSDAHFPETATDTWRHGQSTSYVCDVGYLTRGCLDVTCNLGTWERDDPSATCIWDCDATVTGLPDHSSVTCQTGHVEGDTAEVTCAAGYVPEEEIAGECVEKVGWRITGGPCLRDCGPVGTEDGKYVTHASANAQPAETTEGTKADLQCGSGYTESGDIEVQCDEATGAWLPVSGTGSCLRDCGPVSTEDGKYVTHASATAQPAETTEGTKADLQCGSGYTESGDIEVQCDEATGAWLPVSGTGSCLRECGPVSTEDGKYVTHASATAQPAETTEGTKADLQCGSGYTESGDIEVQCDEATGAWLPVSGTGSCLRDCGPVGTEDGKYVTHASATAQPAETTEGTKADLQCGSGYTESGDIEVQCDEATGAWLPVSGTGSCLRDCGPVGTEDGKYVTHASATAQPAETTEGTKADLQCGSGYTESGDIEVQCDEATGAWLPVSGTGSCLRDCGPVSTDDGKYVTHASATAQPAETTEGTKADLQCGSGYTESGDIEVQCDEATGAWLPVSGTGSCLIECGPVSTEDGKYVTHASATAQPAETTEGTKADLQCGSGYTESGDIEVQCDEATGAWLPVSGTGSCLRDCGPVSTEDGKYVTHASATAQPAETTEGTKADLQCGSGYTESGDIEVQCDEATGAWLPVSGTGSCLRDVTDCGPVDTRVGHYLDGAYAAEQPPGTRPGQLAILECDEGYTKDGEILVACHSETLTWKLYWSSGQCLADVTECGPLDTRVGHYLDGAYAAEQPPSTRPGQLAILECDEGYTKDGEIDVLCDAKTFTWKLYPSSGQCLADCLETDLPVVSDASYTLNSAGDRATYTCNELAALVGGKDPADSTCEEGSWTMPDIDCVAMDTKCVTDLSLPDNNKAVRYDDNTCFYIMEETDTWQGAFDKCKSQEGATMATIEDLRMNQFIYQYVRDVIGFKKCFWMPLVKAVDVLGGEFWKDMNTESPATFFQPNIQSHPAAVESCSKFCSDPAAEWIPATCSSSSDRTKAVCKVLAPLPSASRR